MKPHINTGKEKSFVLSLLLTTGTFLFELIGGLWTGSLALLSDSAHVFLDVFALGISYLALRISSRPADDRHSYGYHRLEVLAALINGATLLLISFGIFYEAWKRWLNPAEIKPLFMLGIAVAGLIINLLVARILHTHEHDPNGKSESGAEGPRDLNVHSAYLHVIGDAISSIGVILAAVVIYYTKWSWIDPLMSVIIGIIILSGSYRVLRSSIHILIEGTPEGIKPVEVASAITNINGIEEVHDLHIWSICSGHIALSAHIRLADNFTFSADDLIRAINQILMEKFQIEHTTLQLEITPCEQGC